MDEMLGRPEADPHGDPIPNSEGLVKPQEAQSLLTCPIGTRVTVSRVIDQDKVFLRFIEQQQSEAGRSDRGRGARRGVRQRPRARQGRSADHHRHTGRVEAAGQRRARAALHRTRWNGVRAAALDSLGPGKPPTGSARPFEITDNSFLVEEAFNQEAGVVQNIFGILAPGDGSWVAAFTQEWPMRVHAHQFSYTVALARVDRRHRHRRRTAQLSIPVVGWKRLAGRRSRRACRWCCPRATPLADVGNGGVGWDFNLPLSKQFRDLYLHWNAGFTLLPSAEGRRSLRTHNLLTPRVAASGIWRVRPMFNLMLESVFVWPEEVAGTATERTVRHHRAFRDSGPDGMSVRRRPSSASACP